MVVMEEKYVLNGKEVDVSSFYYKGDVSLHTFKPNHTITFHRQSEDGYIGDKNKVGTLDFNGPALVFEGDAEESAKVFIDWVATYFATRLREEYQRGYEDCLTEEAKK